MYENVYDEIMDGLFLGSANALAESDKFAMIINCTPNSQIALPKDHKNAMRIPINDEPKDSIKFLSLIYETDVIDLMHNSLINKEPVLVHCFSGVQRSCALVACYLIKYYKMTPSIAIQYIKEKRPISFFGRITLIKAIEQFYEDLQEN